MIDFSEVLETSVSKLNVRTRTARAFEVEGLETAKDCLERLDSFEERVRADTEEALRELFGGFALEKLRQ